MHVCAVVLKIALCTCFLLYAAYFTKSPTVKPSHKPTGMLVWNSTKSCVKGHHMHLKTGIGQTRVHVMNNFQDPNVLK